MKEKAKELVLLFTNHYISCPHTRIKIAKEYALICVDDEIKMLDELGNKLYSKLGTDSYMERCIIYDLITELKEVKQEIEKL